MPAVANRLAEYIDPKTMKHLTSGEHDLEVFAVRTVRDESIDVVIFDMRVLSSVGRRSVAEQGQDNTIPVGTHVVYAVNMRNAYGGYKLCEFATATENGAIMQIAEEAVRTVRRIDPQAEIHKTMPTRALVHASCVWTAEMPSGKPGPYPVFTPLEAHGEDTGLERSAIDTGDE